MSLNTPYRLYKDIDLSFTANALTKDINKKLDVNAVKQSLISLIFTMFNERPFQPDLGSPIYKLLFEPVDTITTEAIKRAIENLIQNHEPRVILNRLDVVPSEDEHEYLITIFFTVVGIPLPVTFTTVLHRLR